MLRFSLMCVLAFGTNDLLSDAYAAYAPRGGVMYRQKRIEARRNASRHKLSVLFHVGANAAVSVIILMVFFLQ